jgi:hypothetical protein
MNSGYNAVRKLWANYFYIEKKIYITSGADTWDGQFPEVGWSFHGIPVGSRVFFLPPGYSFRLPGILGAEVVDAQDDSSRGSFTKRLYLAAMPSHVGERCGWASQPSASAYGS